MKRSHAFVLATTVALVLAAGFGHAASAAASKQRSSPTGSTVASGKIGTALPRAGAAARIRALGLDDGGGGGLEAGDDGGRTAGGQAARGTIGSAPPRTGAAGRIVALGLDD